MKTMTEAAVAASGAEIIDCAVLLELHFDSGTEYVNLSGGNITWNGHVWIGAGHVASITDVAETADFEITGFNVSMNIGDFAAQALGEKVRGRPAKAWLLFFDADGKIVEDPVLIGAGRMDRMPIKLGKNGRIDLSVINRVADWQKTNPARMTDAEQKSRYAGDRGFEQMSQTVEREIPWGPTG